MRESSAYLCMVACAHITSTVEHHTVFRDRKGGITDCVVVTMALVSDLSHSRSFCRTKFWPTLCHGDSLLDELYQRHLTTSIIRSPLPHHHGTSLQPYLPLHSSQQSPSPPWLARCFPFRLGQGEIRQRVESRIAGLVAILDGHG